MPFDPTFVASCYSGKASPATTRGHHRPKGLTVLAKSMRKILNPYVQRRGRCEDQTPANLVVSINGYADDDVQAVIGDAANRLDVIQAVPWLTGIQFFQGGDDAKATVFLE